MNELVTINFEEQTISARELHESLNIKSIFTTWFSRMCEYGFIEGRDFFPKMEESTGGRPSTDYEIKIDMAKEICMIQRTPEGKKVREYLIDLEKAWNTPEQVMARALKMADRTINSLKEDNRQLIEENETLSNENQRFVEQIEEMQPQIEYLDQICRSEGKLTATEIGAEYGISAVMFNRLAEEYGLIRRVNGKWVPCSAYARKGIMTAITRTVDKEKNLTKTWFEWNQTGRKIAHDVFAKHGHHTLKEQKHEYAQIELDLRR